MLWSWRGLSGLRWAWHNGRGPHLEVRQDLRLPLLFGLQPQGSCRVGTGESGLVLSEEGNSACLSSCSRGARSLLELCVVPAGFSGRYPGVSVPLSVVLHQKGYLQRGVRASGSYQERTGKSGSFGMCHHPRGYVSNILVRPASS